MARRAEPVVEFPLRPEPGPLKGALDILTAVLGKMVSIADVLLLANTAGHTVTNAASGAGTALAFTRALLDLADAGVDQVRAVARGNAGAAGTVQVTVHDVTNSVELARVAVTNASDVTVAGTWTAVAEQGGDREIEVRVIGDGALDPVLFRVSLQVRTVQRRA